MSNSEEKSYSGVVAVYASSKIYRQLLGIVTTFLRPKILGPEIFGIWTLLKVIPTYAAYANLGTFSSLRYRLPYFQACENHDEVEQIKGNTFSTAFFLNVLLGLIILVLCFKDGFSKEVVVGLLCMSLLVVLQFFHHYYFSLLKAHERFGLITKTNYLETTVTFILTIPLLLIMGIYGLYVTLLLASLAVVLFLKKNTNIAYRPMFSAQKSKLLIADGFPIMVLELSIMLVTTSDRFVVSGMLNNESLGFYGIAILVVSFLRNMPGTAREVLEPRLMKSLKDGQGVEVTEEYLLKPLLNTAWLMPFLIGPAVLAIPPVIHILLPRYVDGIVPTQVLSCGVFFLAMAYVLRTVVVAFNWQVKAALFMPLVLAVNVGLSILAVYLGYGIVGVAAASGLAFFLLFLALFHYTSKNLEHKGDRWRASLWACVPPFPFMCIVLYLLTTQVPRLVEHSILVSAITLPIYGILLFLVHRIAAKSNPMIASLGDLLPKKISKRLPNFLK